MRAGHIIGIDLKFRLGEELAVPVQQKALADPIAVGLPRVLPGQDPALESAGCAVAAHLL